MRRLIFVLFLIAGSAGCKNQESLSSEKGGDTGVDGGDSGSLLYKERAAWFLGDGKKVNLCIEKGPGFDQFQDKDLEQMVLDAHKEWLAYFKSKKVVSIDDFGINSALTLGDKKTCACVTEACKGSNLIVFFGQENDQIKETKKSFLQPVGFAQRLFYNVKTGDGTGYIWIGNDQEIKWTKESKTLKSIITHELGHTFGIGHITGTIMREEMREFLKDASNEPYVANIDDWQQLVLGYDYPKIRTSSDIIQTFTGSTVTGEALVEVKLTKSSGEIFHVELGFMVDGKNVKTIKLQFYGNERSIYRKGEILARYLEKLEKGNPNNKQQVDVYGEIMTTQTKMDIFDASGTKESRDLVFTVLLNYDSDTPKSSGKFMVYYGLKGTVVKHLVAVDVNSSSK